MHGVKQIREYRSGQALVVLLFYMIIAITLTTTAVAVIVSNSMSVTRSEQGAHALELADAGAENAIIRLLRSTTYTGETLTIGSGTVVVSVTGTTRKIIVSRATIAGFSREIQVTADITNGVLTIVAWEEK